MKTEVFKGTIFILIYGSFSVRCVSGSEEGRFGKVNLIYNKFLQNFCLTDKLSNLSKIFRSIDSISRTK